ncbi:MAG: inositol monophosphatase family protein [Microcystaceae cyanobacterium]
MNADLSNRIALIHRLADVSQTVIQNYFRQPNLTAATKTWDTSSIVTIADQETEEAMVEIIRKELPEDGVIREEGANIPSKNGFSWVIDPIDGTSSFVKGLPIFGTLIGLIEETQPTPLLGLMNQPILQERWLGIAGHSTTLQGNPITNPYVNREDIPLADACLTSTTPLMFVSEKQQAIAHTLQQICQRTAFGGDCYNYVSLATGWSALPMIILESDLKYYDFCALIPILEGSGAIISDWQGNPLKADSSEAIAASNVNLWQQALNVINNV